MQVKRLGGCSNCFDVLNRLYYLHDLQKHDGLREETSHIVVVAAGIQLILKSHFLSLLQFDFGDQGRLLDVYLARGDL